METPFLTLQIRSVCISVRIGNHHLQTATILAKLCSKSQKIIKASVKWSWMWRKGKKFSCVLDVNIGCYIIVVDKKQVSTFWIRVKFQSKYWFKDSFSFQAKFKNLHGIKGFSRPFSWLFICTGLRQGALFLPTSVVVKYVFPKVKNRHKLPRHTKL